MKWKTSRRLVEGDIVAAKRDETAYRPALRVVYSRTDAASLTISLYRKQDVIWSFTIPTDCI